jgi:hypothetical protein
LQSLKAHKAAKSQSLKAAKPQKRIAGKSKTANFEIRQGAKLHLRCSSSTFGLLALLINFVELPEKISGQAVLPR